MPIPLTVPVVVAFIEHPANPGNRISYVRHSDSYGPTYEEYVGVFADIAAARNGLFNHPDTRYREVLSVESYVERDNGDLAFGIPDGDGPDTRRTCVLRVVTL